MKKKIKLFDPKIGHQEEQAIKKTLNSHFWASGEGTGKVLEFETKFRDYVKCDSCIAVNNGTSALHLALTIPEIKNKEVILPSLSFISTSLAVTYNGGHPIFVDIDPHTLCLDPDQVKKKITSKTRVILPVHFGGMPANLNRLQKISSANNCILIEDAAHAAGSKYENKNIGAHGTAVCFSFHPVKNLAMPTGGLIALNDSKHKKYQLQLQARRWCGITDRKGSIYDVKDLGWNMYMNEFSASIGVIQLSRLNKSNKIRKKIAKRYFEEIGLEKKMPYNTECSYHLYWIRTKNRNALMKKLFEKGIETGIHYKPIHQMTFYKNKIKLPITDTIGKEIVSIPIHPNLTEEDVDFIIKQVNNFS